ncbi:MAG: CBS domain-containing protein [Halanaeroarchaeum sp.]
MLVEDLMTTDIVTCDYEASLQTAVVRMLEADVGSVIVEREGDPVGIVTETDSLMAAAASERPLPEIPVAKVLSHPLITIQPGVSVTTAVDRMKEEGVKKLPVADGIELEGIVTLSDVAANCSEIVREARHETEMRNRWEARKADIDEF